MVGDDFFLNRGRSGVAAISKGVFGGGAVKIRKLQTHSHSLIKKYYLGKKTRNKTDVRSRLYLKKKTCLQAACGSSIAPAIKREVIDLTVLSHQHTGTSAFWQN